MWIIELVVIVVMISFNGIFACYELALASVGVGRLHVLVNQQRRGAAAALWMKQNIEASLAVVQLGITLIREQAASANPGGPSGSRCQRKLNCIPVFIGRRETSRVIKSTNPRQLAGTGKASGDIRQIVPAANEGRIEALIVYVEAHQWGRYDPQAAHVELHKTRESGDADLLDLAVAQTLANRRTVYAVERGLVPSGESAAATFRY